MIATVSSHPLALSIERPALYVVATPIGNLADISYRAVTLLKEVDLLLVEDTRVTRRLLQHYSISGRLLPFHDHNEKETVDKVLSNLQEERHAVALLSDAGTPLVADPGYRLVRGAHEKRIPVYTVPGPCAVVAALSIAGIPTDKFVFEGFLPPRSAARKSLLSTLLRESRTLIFYEAPHRIIATMADLCEVFGLTREVAVARELTKLHETLYRGSLGSVASAMKADTNAARGEIVIVLAGATANQTRDEERLALQMVDGLCRQLPKADAIKLAAELTGVKRNHLYRLVHAPASD